MLKQPPDGLQGGAPNVFGAYHMLLCSTNLIFSSCSSVSINAKTPARWSFKAVRQTRLALILRCEAAPIIFYLLGGGW